MWKTLIVAAGLILAGAPAWSQSSSRDRDDSPRGHWHDGYGRWDRDEDRRGRMRGDDERSGSGARFFLRSGDTELRVVCGDEESTRACVDAALTMFDRIQSQRGTTSSPPAASSPPAQ